MGAFLLGCTAGDRAELVPRAEHAEVAKQTLSTINFVGTSLPPKTLALTFDDGPGDRTTELAIYLGAQGIPAVFFVNGARLQLTSLPNPNGIVPTSTSATTLGTLVGNGHLVANHTATHRDLVTQVMPTGGVNVILELSETDFSIAPYMSPERPLFRAPYGSFNATVQATIATSTMNKYVGPIYWDIGGSANNFPEQAADWACWQNALSHGGGATFGATTEECGDAYLSEIEKVGRGIVLLHDPYFSAAGSTVDMVKYIVPILKARGYSFVRVDHVPDIAAMLPTLPCPTCDAGPGTADAASDAPETSITPVSTDAPDGGADAANTVLTPATPSGSDLTGAPVSPLVTPKSASSCSASTRPASSSPTLFLVFLLAAKISRSRFRAIS